MTKLAIVPSARPYAPGGTISPQGSLDELRRSRLPAARLGGDRIENIAGSFIASSIVGS